MSAVAGVLKVSGSGIEGWKDVDGLVANNSQPEPKHNHVH